MAINKALINDLIELKNSINDYYTINSTSPIVSTIELSDDIELPFVFKCEALHPGTFKGFTIPEEEIVAAKDTIFHRSENFFNWDINKDHKSSRKAEASVDDVVGKIIDSEYDYSRQALVLSGEIYDKAMALKIINKLINFVSLRINPGNIEYNGNQKIARNLVFEELSFVRAPGDPNTKIISHSG